MRHDVPHHLDADTAKRVAEKALESYRQQFLEYHPTLAWPRPDRASITFTIKGIKLAATLDILPGAFGIDMDVPFLFRLFKSKAVAVVEGEIRKWIAKAEAGEV